MLGASGCGDDDFANRERAPAPITLSAAITPRDVTVSPARIGAGTVQLIASNLTSSSQQVTLRSETLSAGTAPLEQRTGPINPGDTATLTADLVPGTYRVTTRSDSSVRDAARRPVSFQCGGSALAAVPPPGALCDTGRNAAPSDQRPPAHSAGPGRRGGAPDHRRFERRADEVSGAVQEDAALRRRTTTEIKAFLRSGGGFVAPTSRSPI